MYRSLLQHYLAPSFSYFSQRNNEEVKRKLMPAGGSPFLPALHKHSAKTQLHIT